MFKNLSIKRQNKKNSVKKNKKTKVIDNINKVIDKKTKTIKPKQKRKNNVLNIKTSLTTLSKLKTIKK